MIYAFGLAAIATGIVDLIYGALDPAHQPLQAWGDHVPGSRLYAYALGALLVAGGGGVLLERTRRLGAYAIAFAYLVVAIFWLPRLFTAPSILGYTPAVYIGVTAGVCAEVIVICAALVLANRGGVAVRWVFGLCAICFGLQHLLNVHDANNTSMVPQWMPFGQVFWVALTGTAFVLAGIAIVIRVADVLAARWLAAMLLVFSAVTLIPLLVAAPGDEANWGGKFYEITAAASAWLLGDWLLRARIRKPSS